MSGATYPQQSFEVTAKLVRSREMKWQYQFWPTLNPGRNPILSGRMVMTRGQALHAARRSAAMHGFKIGKVEG